MSVYDKREVIMRGGVLSWQVRMINILKSDELGVS